MSYGDYVNKLNEKTTAKAFKENQWGERHVRAWKDPEGVERPIVGLIEAWITYADEYNNQWRSQDAGYAGYTIGGDGVLGKGWEEIGDGIRTLFNGELGRLDGGTLDQIMCHIFEQEGLEK